jgi:hypothetical protein
VVLGQFADRPARAVVDAPRHRANYSSADIDIVQDGLEFSRLDRYGCSRNGTARRHLRVCTRNPVDAPLNQASARSACGRSSELLVASRLADTAAFPNDDIAPEQVRNVRVRNETSGLV